jgi:broad-specificity NMP kinase
MKVRSKYPRAYEKWSKSEEEILDQLYNEGTSIEEISIVLQRQPTALRSRLKKLGIL